MHCKTTGNSVLTTLSFNKTKKNNFNNPKFCFHVCNFVYKRFFQNINISALIVIYEPNAGSQWAELFSLN